MLFPALTQINENYYNEPVLYRVVKCLCSYELDLLGFTRHCWENSLRFYQTSRFVLYLLYICLFLGHTYLLNYHFPGVSYPSPTLHGNIESTIKPF